MNQLTHFYQHFTTARRILNQVLLYNAWCALTMVRDISIPKLLLYSHQAEWYKNVEDWLSPFYHSTQHFGFGVQSEFIDLALIEF